MVAIRPAYADAMVEMPWLSLYSDDLERGAATLLDVAEGEMVAHL